MYKMYLYKAALLAFGLALLVMGIIIIVQREVLLKPLAIIGGAVLMLHGLMNLINFISKQGHITQKRKKTFLLTAVVNITMGVIVLILPKLSFRIAVIIFALYILLNALSKLADFIILIINRQYRGWLDFFAFLFFLTFSIILFVSNNSTNAFLLTAGIYCIMYGASTLSDFVARVVPKKAKNAIKRKIRISLPVFISTFIPLNTLRYINEYITVNDQLPKLEGPEKEDNNPPDIEVMVHVSNNGSGKIGHLDFCIDGEVISYGNHDWSSHKFFAAFGDGILFTAEKERYIEFSVTHDRKMVFSYGFRLTPEQLSAVKSEIAKLKSLTVPWKAPFERAQEENPKTAKLTDYHDYCSKLWFGTKAKFFKFKKGKFKTYSVLSTNCVLLTDTIIGKAGADIVFINGIASPGIYYDYLEKLYMSPDSAVISKKIYSRKNIRKFKAERKNKNE